MTPRPALTEIQRWSFGCSNSAAAAHMSVSKDEQGKFVLYTDHVAALASQEQRRVVEAKIEALEEAMERMKAHLGLLQNAEVRYAYELLRDRRDALRKEIA